MNTSLRNLKNAPLKEYCETCKAETERCQYYPVGRSRQHGRCLQCDRTDPRYAAVAQSGDKRYCRDCDRAHRLAPSGH